MSGKYLTAIVLLLFLGLACNTPAIQIEPIKIDQIRKAALVRIYFEAINNKNSNVLNEILAEDLCVVMDHYNWNKQMELVLAIDSIKGRHCAVLEINDDQKLGFIIAKVAFPFRQDSTKPWIRNIVFKILNGKITNFEYIEWPRYQ